MDTIQFNVPRSDHDLVEAMEQAYENIQWRKYMAYLEMADIEYDMKIENATDLVFIESGDYDALIDVYREAGEENAEKKKNIFGHIADFISGIIKKIKGVFSGSKGKELPDNTQVQVDESFIKNMPIIGNLAEGICKIMTAISNRDWRTLGGGILDTVVGATETVAGIFGAKNVVDVVKKSKTVGELKQLRDKVQKAINEADGIIDKIKAGIEALFGKSDEKDDQNLAQKAFDILEKALSPIRTVATRLTGWITGKFKNDDDLSKEQKEKDDQTAQEVQDGANEEKEDGKTPKNTNDNSGSETGNGNNKEEGKKEPKKEGNNNENGSSEEENHHSVNGRWSRKGNYVGQGDKIIYSNGTWKLKDGGKLSIQDAKNKKGEIVLADGTKVQASVLTSVPSKKVNTTQRRNDNEEKNKTDGEQVGESVFDPGYCSDTYLESVEGENLQKLYKLLTSL